MTLQEMLKAHAELVKQAETLTSATDEKCKAEKRDWTDDEVKAVENVTTQASELWTKVERARSVDGLRQKVTGMKANLSDPMPRRVTTDPAPVSTSPLTAVEGWKKDPKKGFTNLKQMLGQVLVVSREFGRNVKSAVKAGRVNEAMLQLCSPDDRVCAPGTEFCAPAGMEVEQTAGSDEHGEYNDASLGFLIPEPLLPGVLTVAPPTDIGANTLQIPMPSPLVRIPARTDKDNTTSVSGGLRVYRRGETQTVAPSKMEIHRISLIANTLMGVTFETEELLQDAPAAAIALIQQGFTDEFSSRRVRELLRGSGAGEFLGILNSPALVTVPKEAGQPADSFTFNNASEMMSRAWGYGQGAWIANHGLIPQLAKMNAGVNGLVWQPSARDGLPNTLLGRPILFTEYCSAPGDVGDIIYANWTQYLEGLLQGLMSGESTHVRFLEHERTFKFVKRDAGAPWWNAPLTPVFGPTLSPFVTLAAR